MGKNHVNCQRAYQEFLAGFDGDDEGYFGQMEEPVGYQDFLDHLVREKGRYMPRRKGRVRARI